MDISLIETRKGTKIIPTSIHGMLWLQTHFEEANWELLSNQKVIIKNEEAKELAIDAEEAGINLNLVPVLSSNFDKL